MPSDRWISGRVTVINTIIRALDSALDGTAFAGKIVSTRYTDGLLKLGRAIRQRLLHDLRAYLGELAV